MKIDKGLQMPESKGSKKRIIGQMQVGDSVFFETVTKAMSFRNLGKIYFPEMTFKLTKWEVGHRVWRIK